MRIIQSTWILVTVVLLNACAFKKAETPEKQSHENKNDVLLFATLYQQTAAEKDALSYQAFNWAKQVIQNDMKRMGLSKKQAVVVDIDETVLNNAPYEAECILDNMAYPERWQEWIESAQAKPLPGAVEFLDYATEQGYEIFYITNRKEKFRKATLENLRKFNFPMANDEHLFMRTDESSKDARRKKVTENHRIVLLMGDNLSDFATIFDHKPLEDRKALVEENKDKFGFQYIALPNAMYGAWLEALYNYENDLSENDKMKLMIKQLEGF